MQSPSSLIKTLNRHAGKLLLLGLLALLARHGRAWRRDRRAVAAVAEPEAPPPLADWPAHPKVSILVAAWNETDHLPALVASFRRLRYPHREMVLCAGGEDGTYELAGSLTSDDLHLLQQRPGEGKFAALARCFAASRGAIILLTDADCRLNDLAFESLIYPLAGGGETAATGRFQPLVSQVDHSFIRRQWAQQRYPQVADSVPGAAAHTQFLAGANCAVRRELLDGVWNVGDVGAADDLYLAMSIQEQGARILSVPASCLETEFPATAASYVRQQARWRRVHLSQAQRFGRTAFLRQVRLTLLVESAMLLMPFAILLGKIGAALWMLSWTSYGLAHLRYGWVLSKIERLPHKGGLRGIPSIVLANFAAAALVLSEPAVPNPRERW